MRKIFVLSSLLIALFVTVATAQTTEDYFVGNWEVLVTGLPDGDATLTVTFEKVDGKLTGKMTGADGNVTPFSSVELGDNTVTANFTSNGFDVYLKLVKSDQDKVSGTMLDMFNATGSRIKA